MITYTNPLDNVMEVFGQYRMPDSNISKWNDGGAKALREKIASFVNNGRQIRFLMLGYPFKSTNHVHKTIGTLPDLAEQLSLERFALFGNEVKKVYDQGVEILILSDGFVFNDILGETESVVDAYHEGTVGMAKSAGAPTNILTLRDIYPGVSLGESRGKMAAQFGINDVELERRILNDANVNWLYRAMIRFMEEETENHLSDYPSKRQHHLSSKSLARTMMLRNELYSEFADKEMPEYIRLSMHATTNDHKWGFKLIPGERSFFSPWHCVILKGPNGEVSTIHRKDAEAAGHKLVNVGSQPYFYEAV